LSALLTRPDHSLIDQSLHARQNVETTNGDGFGVGWYTGDDEPGIYRETQPAWNDVNLRCLADHIRSPLFLAHVRAATGTPVQYTNCHPFAFQNWLFQHNGSVPAFSRLKRQLMFAICPDLFCHVQGSTDSEILFFLALTFGLRDDPPSALERTVGFVERIRQEARIEQPFYFTAAASDGRRLFAVRYSSHRQSRTLYHSCHAAALRECDRAYEQLPAKGVVVVSEPLDELHRHWTELPESTLVLVEAGNVETRRFQPCG
jgi:glutamine amidotransferase